jgi:hypothetical protein
MQRKMPVKKESKVLRRQVEKSKRQAKRASRRPRKPHKRQKKKSTSISFSFVTSVKSPFLSRLPFDTVKLNVTLFLAVEHADRDAGVFADAERVKLLSAESFKLASMIDIYGGFFG